MNSTHTLIFQHLHRTGGTTLYSIMKRYFDADTNYIIDALRNGKRFSVEYFLGLPQNEKDSITLLRGHMPFGLHIHFSHPCDYITIVRDPVERILSEYARLTMWRDISHIRNFEKLKGISLKDFVTSNFAAANNYQTRVLSGNWTGQYEEASLLEEGVLEDAKHNLRKYFTAVGVTDRLDETVVILAKIFGWKNPYYAKKRQVGKYSGTIPQGYSEIHEIIRDKNKLDNELYQFAGKMLEESIMHYGPNFKRDFRRFRFMNNCFGAFYNIGRRLPDSLRKPIKRMLRTTGYENLLP